MRLIVLGVIFPAAAGLLCVSLSLFLLPYVPESLSPEVLIALAVTGVLLLVFATLMKWRLSRGG